MGELTGKNAPLSVEILLWQGMYPPVIDRRIPPAGWYSDYVAAYIERDVRQLINVRDLSAFRRFVRMCAMRTAQLLNLSSLAADCGVTHNTAKAWISVLEASYIVHLLSPYHRNFGKRLIKSPKLYFLDTGLAAALAGIREAGELTIHPMRGALYESWVIAELLKRRFNRAQPADVHFWRDSGGNEVDAVIEHGGRFHALEVKSGKTIAADYLTGLERFSHIAANATASLVYAGDDGQRRSHAVIFGWREIEAAAKRFFG